MKAYFTVQTFGTPARRLNRRYLDLSDAITAADTAKGTGSCTVARVYVHQSRRLAHTADISRVRAGESIAYEAR